MESLSREDIERYVRAERGAVGKNLLAKKLH